MCELVQQLGGLPGDVCRKGTVRSRVWFISKATDFIEEDPGSLLPAEELSPTEAWRRKPCTGGRGSSPAPRAARPRKRSPERPQNLNRAPEQLQGSVPANLNS